MPAKSGIARFKLVISATRDGVELHPSVEDLPAERQREAREALDGDLAATLLIADKAGLHRMRRTMARLDRVGKADQGPMSLARQLGIAFLTCGFLLLALLLWAWLR